MTRTGAPADVTGGSQATSKVAAAFAEAAGQGRAALVGYLPAGFPSVSGAIDAATAMAAKKIARRTINPTIRRVNGTKNITAMTRKATTSSDSVIMLRSPGNP